MVSKLALFLAITAALISHGNERLADAREVEIKVTGDLHTESNPNKSRGSCNASESCVSNLQELFDPEMAMTQIKSTQHDTIDGIVHADLGDHRIPLYRFRQPQRISEEQLPFQLALVNTIRQPHRISHAASHRIARDSWFPGYYWSMTLICHCKNHTYHQVGWKFTSNEVGDDDSFYALIVAAPDSSKRTPTAFNILSQQAPGWMLSTMIPANETSTGGGRFGKPAAATM
eukprot:CAMPEP_0119545466 /NCGR_PEP_ID=MMETSP1352-20130426/215_1 /TAXON_ID=265584 /ORGANISM="Stauroneis constricta, Strain CCMP1120" /LENGTH=230 /DNA_ID=CAMNT_0007590013 /DNA_START=501 /DNA_END=1193 /DNA_ORIENTATION=+